MNHRPRLGAIAAEISTIPDPLRHRCRIYHVSWGILLDILNNELEGNFVTLVGCEKIPKDAHVRAVWDDQNRRTLGIRVHSKEFEPVPDGETPPQFYEPLEYRIVCLPKNEPPPNWKG